MGRQLGSSDGENISDEVATWAKLRPHTQALCNGKRSLTFDELENAIVNAQIEIAGLGFNAGDRVLVVGENSIDFSVFLLAAARMRLILVLVNARQTSIEIQKTISHSEPLGQFYFHDHSVESAEHSIIFKASIRNSPSFGEFGFIKSEIRKTLPIDPKIFAIIYTTGTTGSPKGVMLTHSNLRFIAKMMHQLREINPNDRVLAILPISHVMGLASVFLGALYSGAAVYFLPKFTSSVCLEFIKKYQITVLQGAPIMFSKLVSHVLDKKLNGFTSLRFLGSGGAPISKKLKEDVFLIFANELQNGYGLTEIPSISWTRFNDGTLDDSVGLPLPGVEVEFRKSDGTLAKVGEVGELWTRGPNLMSGYFKNPELTSQLIDGQGWFNSQDLGYINPNGHLYIVGREKDMIIRSGFKVYPLEIESVLLSHPYIQQAAVIGYPISGNEEVWAFIEGHKDHILSIDEINSYLNLQLSPYKRPSKIILVENLPLAANGKVLKSKLMSEFIQKD